MQYWEAKVEDRETAKIVGENPWTKSKSKLVAHCLSPVATELASKSGGNLSSVLPIICYGRPPDLEREPLFQTKVIPLASSYTCHKANMNGILLNSNGYMKPHFW